MKNKKIILLVSIIAIILIGVVGVAYAYSYLTTGSNQQLVLGDIYMNYNETNMLTLENAMPSESYDTSKYFEFTINGKNTYEDKDIYYEIVLNHGDSHATRTERIQDNLLKFTLIEIKDNTETIVVNGASYDEINNTRMWVNTIGKNTTSDVNITYRLYMWISSDTTICGGTITGCDYDMDTWNNQVYASIKVNVLGDFEEKNAGPTAAEKIMAKVGSDGLVAINNDGGLYSGTGTIREYRYSGLDVNNYIYFNCKDNDGTYDYGDTNYNYESNCETWRVVGIFEEDGEQVIKIMRNTVLTAAEVPESYENNGSNPYLDFLDDGGAFWNFGGSNDWTTAGLQYFLNTENDDNGTPGYISTLTTNAEELIRTTTYNLGNVSSETDTVITSYNSERGTIKCASSVYFDSHNSNCNIWYGNQPTWSGKIALLYPSDYGYSASNTYWTTLMYNYDTAQDSVVPCETSWMQAIDDHADEWFLSPSSTQGDYEVVMYWKLSGSVDYLRAQIGDTVYARPCLYLVSSAKILLGDGSSNSPYVVIS